MRQIIEYFKGWEVDANTTATILLTLLTFSLGLLFTWMAGQLKSLKEKRSYKRSLIYILKDFSKACTTQHKTVIQSLEKAGLKKGNDFIINYVPIGTLDYLNKLDFNIFLKNFEPLLFKKNYSKAISKLFELIAQIKIQNDAIAGFSNLLFEAYKKHEKQFYENVDGLRKIHDEVGVQLNATSMQKEKEGDLIQGYFKVFREWQANGEKTDIASEHEEIVLKTLQLNRLHPNILLILTTNELALKADAAYLNVEKIDKMLAQKFKDFAHFHSRASRLTNIIIKIIE
jgi:hypothetical protein